MPEFLFVRVLVELYIWVEQFEFLSFSKMPVEKNPYVGILSHYNKHHVVAKK